MRAPAPTTHLTAGLALALTLAACGGAKETAADARSGGAFAPPLADAAGSGGASGSGSPGGAGSGGLSAGGTGGRGAGGAPGDRPDTAPTEDASGRGGGPAPRPGIDAGARDEAGRTDAAAGGPDAGGADASGGRAGAGGAGGAAACGAGVRCRDMTAGALGGRAYAPAAGTPGAPWPLIALLPGGGAGIDSVEWAALRLARAGYVVATVKPATATPLGYSEAARIEIDYMLSPASPFAAETDAGRVGAAGWSLGARALSKNQAEDTRIDAIVAWDNLATSEAGDAGSPSVCQTGRLLTGPARAPRVPSLGQASDQCATSQPRESKKTAYDAWRAAGVPAMELVFANSSHFFWSSMSPDATHELAHHYTLAWFDRWVKNDQNATARLLSRAGAAGKPFADLLSTRFTSAAFLDGRDCPDLRAACD